MTRLNFYVDWNFKNNIPYANLENADETAWIDFRFTKDNGILLTLSVFDTAETASIMEKLLEN